MPSLPLLMLVLSWVWPLPLLCVAGSPCDATHLLELCSEVALPLGELTLILQGSPRILFDLSPFFQCPRLKLFVHALLSFFLIIRFVYVYLHDYIVNF